MNQAIADGAAIGAGLGLRKRTGSRGYRWFKIRLLKPLRIAREEREWLDMPPIGAEILPPYE
jgi:hypothetical protein